MSPSPADPPNGPGSGASSEPHRNRISGDETSPVLLAAAPLTGQILLLVMMIVQRQWTFAAMTAVGLTAPAVWLVATIRRRRRLHDRATEPPPSAPLIEPGQTILCPSLEELMDISPAPLDAWRGLVRRWVSQAATTAMRATIGTDAHGSPFSLDLGANGPHALVAGTTGSGKSVLLRSWCLALAAANPPDRLLFVFLDFKGGAAMTDLEALPHVVGSVSDLDLSHARRALRALESELTRRERLAARHRVPDIRRIDPPPPAIVVVIDEFHALRGRLPGYMDRLDRLASLGRSLGMHVIACTQSPLGQVGGEMKANMSLNICLRVRDSLQSVELIGDARAAAISPREPGTAYCNDGEGITRFRCADAGDAAALVTAIRRAADVQGSPPPPRLFSEPLPRSLPVLRAADGDRGRREGHGIDVVFGLADDGVRLSPAVLRLVPGEAVMIVGGPGSGRDILLRTVTQAMRRCRGLRLLRPMRDGDAGSPSTRSKTSDDDRHPQDSSPHDGEKRSGVTTVWLMEDADALLDPASPPDLLADLNRALATGRSAAVLATAHPDRIRLDGATTRIVFPSMDRAANLMNGIPSALLDELGDDAGLPGRAVMIGHGGTMSVQCALRVEPESEKP